MTLTHKQITIEELLDELYKNISLTLRNKDIDGTIAYTIIYSLIHQSYLCKALKLSCRDTPTLSTSTLMSMSIFQKSIVEKMWKKLFRMCKTNSSWIIFDNGVTTFKLKLEVDKGPIYYSRKYNILVDRFDCYENTDLDCKIITKTNRLFVFIESNIGTTNVLRLNLVHVLKKLFDLNLIELVKVLACACIDYVNFRLGYNQNLEVLNLRFEEVKQRLEQFKSLLEDVLQTPYDKIFKYIVITHKFR